MDDSTTAQHPEGSDRTIELRIVQSMADIPQPSWDGLLKPGDRPFLSWTFLEALERTGCAAGERGWLPFHLTAWTSDNTLLAAAPAYIKK